MSAMWLAAAVAVLWTVHPLQTEAVTYISERCELLMGLFYVLTMYCFIRGTDAPRSSGWFALSVVSCVLGMASKEVMVTAPVMVLLYDRTFVSGSFREAWTRRRRLYLELASTWVLLGWLMVGLHYRSVGYGLGIPWWAYARIECRAVLHYLWLAFWPHPLVFDYGEYVPIQRIAEVIPSALILAILGAGVLFELKRRPAIGFVGAWFFVILAPTSSVVPVVAQPMAEHRMYLPLAAVVALVVLGGFGLGRSVRSARHPTQRMIRWGVTGVLVLMLAILTMKRNNDYSSEVTLWNDTAEKNPGNPRAHYALAMALGRSGRVGEAIGHYEQALRIKPDYAEAHYNLGITLEQAGREPEAGEQYEQALRIKPDYADVHNNLGNVFLKEGKVNDAIGQYEQALRIKPGYAEAHYNLGLALARLGRLPEAVGHWEQALRIKPDYAEAHYNLGITLEQAGREPEAKEQYEQALRIKPDYADVHNNLGNVSLKEGQVNDAIGHYEQALRIKPGYAEAHYNLGIALAQTGKTEEAVAHFGEALRINPDYVEAHFNLALALEKLGRTPESIEQYQQALKLRSDFVPAKNALTRLQARQ